MDQITWRSGWLSDNPSWITHNLRFNASNEKVLKQHDNYKNYASMSLREPTAFWDTGTQWLMLTGFLRQRFSIVLTQGPKHLCTTSPTNHKLVLFFHCWWIPTLAPCKAWVLFPLRENLLIQGGLSKGSSKWHVKRRVQTDAYKAFSNNHYIFTHRITCGLSAVKSTL